MAYREVLKRTRQTGKNLIRNVNFVQNRLSVLFMSKSRRTLSSFVPYALAIFAAKEHNIWMCFIWMGLLYGRLWMVEYSKDFRGL